MEREQIEFYLTIMSNLVNDIMESDDYDESDLLNIMASGVALTCVRVAEKSGRGENSVFVDILSRSTELKELIMEMINGRMERN